MKIAIYAASTVLVVCLLALLLVAVITFSGTAWDSFEGTDPAWPGVLGFSALYGLVLSGAVLAVLIAVAVFRRRRHSS